MTQFVGSWELVGAKNLEALCNKLGLKDIKKEFMDNPKGVIAFKLDGNKMTYKMDNPVRKSEITFTFGEEFEEVTFGERKVKSKYTKESESKITLIQTSPGNVTHAVYEVHGEKLTSTVTMADVTAEFTFHKMPHT